MNQAQPIPVNQRVEFNEDAFNDAILSIKGDPNCKLGGCHGKGYLGISVRPDGSRLILLCRCGRWVETDYIKLMKRLDSAEKNIIQSIKQDNTVSAYLIMQHTDKRTLAGFIANTTKAIKKGIEKHGRKHKENPGS